MAVSVGSFTSVEQEAASLKTIEVLAPAGCDISSLISLPLNIFLTCILLCVKIPVLSAQITVVFPIVSSALILLTVIPFFKRRCIPKATTIVEIAGKPSGIAATASAAAFKNVLTVR